MGWEHDSRAVALHKKSKQQAADDAKAKELEATANAANAAATAAAVSAPAAVSTPASDSVQ